MNQEEVIAGCIRQEHACQKHLFDLVSGKMMTVCLRYARNRADAEDILQEGFVLLFKNIAKYQGTGSFEGWIRRIFVNTALKKYQRKRFDKERVGIEHVQEPELDATALSSLSEQEIIALIQELPEGYRIVFNMFAIEGYSHKEIAAQLGINEATSRTQLLKARKQLQRKLLKLHSIPL
ncbi:MAG: sigma-70 family RNA polymerase sigma factor [Saprospiraceae bacterium]|nr:sigma-70 family RNA polymerase sigma factor [Saprospiraceae bacterium]